MKTRVSYSDQNRASVLKAQVRVGVVTALPKEFVAMKAMLDQPVNHGEPGKGAGREYCLGKIPAKGGGSHVVALALAGMGNNQASARATLLLEHFQNIDAILMVGIAGGVPNPENPDHHVRLGDIVVSDYRGVIQYDLVKETANGTEIFIEHRHSPHRPSARLLEAVLALETLEYEDERPWDTHVFRARTLKGSARPPDSTDVLHASGEPACIVVHPNDPQRVDGLPRIFRGPIASANVLLKNPQKRDRLRDQFGVKAVEMEGSGVMDATWNHETGYLVIRGICDYCDPSKGDSWQNYAAVGASAYARAILEHTRSTSGDIKKTNINKKTEGPVESKAVLMTKESKEIQIGYFRHSDHERFTEQFGDRLAEASRVVMMGSGLAILGRPAIVESLMRRAASGMCTVEIYMANPFSPVVESRLIEEEQGSIRPPDGKQGLLNRLATLLDCWTRVGSPESVSIKVCSYYPTFALLIIDGDRYVYPYSYRTLGNFSPVLGFSTKIEAHKDILTFLDHHHTCLKEDAVDAKQILNPIKPAREALDSFAVFFVPRVDSELYHFGTRILGYDVRDKRQAQSPWQTYVGRASEFGFHLTLCDALYFHNNAGVRNAEAEVAYLAKDFHPFELRGLKLTHGYPGAHTASIEVTEPSEEIESLKHEFVHRIYRCAAASDYTLNHVPGDYIAGNGSRFLLNRYHDPFIFSRFRPHFTLLSDCGPEAWSFCSKELQASFEETVHQRSVMIDQLAIMRRSSSDGHWSISKEFQLG